MDRRHFIERSLLTGLLVACSARTILAQHRASPRGFFRLAKKGERHYLLDPKGRPFFSLGMNHLDSSTLRYVENQTIWQQKYRNSQKKWLRQLRKNLRAWDFNSVGWTADVVTKTKDHHRHSRPLIYEEYQWLDMPYCHRLPFADFHHYESEMRHPDFFSQGFADWCDYVAREQCARFADDPKLIGYFYLDCPAWIHTRQEARWKGPIFDPEMLESETGQQEVFKIAQQYYKVCHDAIRRYDPHHLILGDRYEANRPWTEVVFKAAQPYVDVMSFQCFGDGNSIRAKMQELARITQKPILLADFGVPDYGTFKQGFISNDWEKYADVLEQLPDVPALIGAHFCGAYLRNRKRRYGILDEQDAVDPMVVDVLKRENQLLQQRIAAVTASP